MRSCCLLLLSLCAPLVGCSDPESTATQDAQQPRAPLTACTQAHTQARQDFAHGRYELHSLEFQPLPNTYLDVLARSYHIQWRFVDNMAPASHFACYDSLMWQLLKHKYGPHFAQQAQQQADSLDRTGTWNQTASFPGGIEQLQPWVWQQVKWSRLSRREGRVFACFTVDSLGAIRDVRLLKSLDASHDQEVLRVLQQMPRWKPAYREGKPYALPFTVPIVFSEVARKDYALKMK
jgi:TonB family protein